MIVYRIQDADGRGPWRPGFSHKWVEERPDQDNLLPWPFEFGMIHLKACTWESIGCGCLTVKQLKRWFTETEYRKLKEYGYQSVEIESDRILAKSNIQCVFTRLKPLAQDVKPFDLYTDK